MQYADCCLKMVVVDRISNMEEDKALGLEHMSTLNIVNDLGLLYKDQG